MYRRNMSGKLKKVVMFIRLSILLLLSRPFKQTFFSVAVVASKQTHFLSLIKESDFNTHGLTSTFI